MLAAILLSLFGGYQYGGTFIGAVICSDGIVLASDSRTTFMDGSGRAFGYLDGMQKIYVDRGAGVAVSGLTSVEGELFSSFVDQRRDLLLRPVNEILFGLLVWLPFANDSNVGMISAGYLNGSPMICSKSPILPQTCAGGGFISSKTSGLLRDTLSKLGRLPTTAEAAAALREAIAESARMDPKVGGPVSILKLSPSDPPQWSGPPPSDGGIKRICDLVRNRRSEIKPVTSQQDLDLHLKAACPEINRGQ